MVMVGCFTVTRIPPLSSRVRLRLCAKVLQSCHWTPEVLSAPLAEAAGRGHLEVCEASKGRREVQGKIQDDTRRGQNYHG